MKRILSLGVVAWVVAVLVVLTMARGDPATANPDGPVAYWPFDTNANDFSGNGNNGTLVGGAATTGASAPVPGDGKSVSLDGVDDYVSVADSSTLDFGTGDFTVSVWLKFDSSGWVFQKEYGVVDKNSSFSNTPGWGMEISTWGESSGDFHVNFYITNQTIWGNTNAGTAAGLASDVWHHIAAVRTGTTTRIYHNGLLADTNVHAQAAANVDNGQPIKIGDHSWGPSFPGLIDEVRIWSRALTAGEVLASTQGLAALWHLDEETGTSAVDSSGNGNNGTLAVSPNDPAWNTPADSKFGSSSLDFDGDDYVTVPNDLSLEPTSVTVQAWVNRSGSPGAYSYILSKGASDCTAASYALYTGGSGGLRFYVFNGSSGVLSPDAGTGVWDGNWHHVAGSFDGSHVRLYVDGAEVGSGTSTSISIGYSLPSGNDLLVGAYRDTCNLHYSGLIDEVCVWNRALSASEIATYASGVPCGNFPVDIDIKPGSDLNCINPDGNGVIPVAILSTPDFDATTVDPASVALDGAGVAMKGKSNRLLAAFEDVNGDGLLDLVVKIVDNTLLAGSTTATLTGETFDGMPIAGTDSICIVP